MCAIASQIWIGVPQYLGIDKLRGAPYSVRAKQRHVCTTVGCTEVRIFVSFRATSKLQNIWYESLNGTYSILYAHFVLITAYLPWFFCKNRTTIDLSFTPNARKYLNVAQLLLWDEKQILVQIWQTANFAVIGFGFSEVFRRLILSN